MESPSKVIAAFLGVFIAGAVFGGFFTLGIDSRSRSSQPDLVSPPSAPAAPAPAPRKEPGQPQNAAQRPLLQIPQTWQAPQLMRRYAERLDLTVEQKERIHPLIQRATEDYRRLQQNTFRETGIMLQRLQQDIAKELTPEQRKKLEKMEERQRDALQKLEQRQRELKKAMSGSKPGANRAGKQSAEMSESQNSPTPAPRAEADAPTASGSSSAASGTLPAPAAPAEKRE